MSTGHVPATENTFYTPFEGIKKFIAVTTLIAHVTLHACFLLLSDRKFFIHLLRASRSSSRLRRRSHMSRCMHASSSSRCRRCRTSRPRALSSSSRRRCSCITSLRYASISKFLLLYKVIFTATLVFFCSYTKSPLRLY